MTPPLNPVEYWPPPRTPTSRIIRLRPGLTLPGWADPAPKKAVDPTRNKPTASAANRISFPDGTADSVTLKVSW